MEYAFSNDIFSCFEIFPFSVPLGPALFCEAANIIACVSFFRNVCGDVHNSVSCSHLV